MPLYGLSLIKLLRCLAHHSATDNCQLCIVDIPRALAVAHAPHNSKEFCRLIQDRRDITADDLITFFFLSAFLPYNKSTKTILEALSAFYNDERGELFLLCQSLQFIRCAKLLSGVITALVGHLKVFEVFKVTRNSLSLSAVFPTWVHRLIREKSLREDGFPLRELPDLLCPLADTQVYEDVPRRVTQQDFLLWIFIRWSENPARSAINDIRLGEYSDTLSTLCVDDCIMLQKLLGLLDSFVGRVFILDVVLTNTTYLSLLPRDMLFSVLPTLIEGCRCTPPEQWNSAFAEVIIPK